MQTAEILKSIREKNKLTQDQMADRVMVSRQAVSRWKMGRFPAFRTFRAVQDL